MCVYTFQMLCIELHVARIRTNFAEVARTTKNFGLTGQSISF